MEDQVDYNESVEKFELMLTQEQVNTMKLQDLLTIQEIIELVHKMIEMMKEDDLEKRMKLLIERVQHKLKEKMES